MKKILDVCCGGKMMWFDKNNPLVLFSDNRRKPKGLISNNKGWGIDPDELNDFRALPYPDASFNMVVFDPPHILRKNPELGIMPMKYGVLHPDTWKQDILAGFNEGWRVLKEDGTLIFKWNEQQKKIGEVIDIFPVEPLFGHRVGTKTKTHWLVFMKLKEKEG